MTTDDGLKGWREHVQTAYLELRTKNHTIPSEVLEEMRDILLSHRANVHDSAGVPFCPECGTCRAATENVHDSGDADAARYRWLRDNSAEQFAHPIVVSQDKRETGIRYFGPVIGKSLDKAIDAAIIAEKGNDNA